METNTELAPITPLLDSMGWRESYHIVPLPRLGNNRVFRVQGDKKSLLLKVYFHDSEDTRDRLNAEYSFLEFSWTSGIRSVPQPLAQDKKNKMALYEFIEGTPLTIKDVTVREMVEAARFFVEINQHKKGPLASKLGPASEATFSLKDQLDTVHARFRSLASIDIKTSRFHAQAHKFVEKKLLPAWKTVVEFIDKEASRGGIQLDSVLDQDSRCLSPSDFGFHNAIRTGDGRLRFFDFEYAGWDDPAKMVSDFFHQPRFRIPKHVMPDFTQNILSASLNPNFLARKIVLARPIFGIKWSCIMLNDFLPLGDRKRKFSVGNEKWEERLHHRLQNSQEQLKRIFPLSSDLGDWN